jgi:hypothetical protein
MKRTFLTCSILLILSSLVFSQSTKSKVILKNGVMMKGEIVEFVQDDYLIIHVMKGQDMRIPADYIRSFKIKKGKMSTYNLPKQGYYNYTKGGFLFLKANEFDGVQVNMSVHTINGYRYNQFYGAGLGVGLDRYGSTSALPVYLSIYRDLLASKVTPTFNGNIGYGWMWEINDGWEEFDQVKGGLYWELGAGLRINYNKTALIFNYAYKRQNSELTISEDLWWRAENTIKENHKFRNMTLTVGMEF